MESEILKFICANQGAVDVDYMMFNLFPGESICDVISNQNKFVLDSSYGKKKVVARTSLKLCRKKDCPGSCSALHLCKNFLFVGVCPYIENRKFCSFSHYLNSEHNQRLLKEHELEGLSRAELGTLLLQSDHTLLPCICFDYNKGKGEFGLCQSGIACARLHICRKYLSQDCSCPRNHDFYAPQPLKTLNDKRVPYILISSLRSIYTNKETLRCFGDRGAQDHRGRGSFAASSNADAQSDDDKTVTQRQFNVGRGRARSAVQRGNGGNRGTPPQQQTAYPSDSLEDGVNEGNNPQQELFSFNCDAAAVANDTDAESNNVLNSGRGRGGNRGNVVRRRHGRTLRTQLLSNTNSESIDLSSKDRSNESDDGQRSPNIPDREVSFLDITASGISDHSKQQTSAVGGGDDHLQRIRRTQCIDNIYAAFSSKHGNEGDVLDKKTKPVRDKTEICMYFIKGYCKHDDRCFKAHDKMPYRWQILEGDQWNNLSANETIEKDYCEPENTYSRSSPPVHFDTMTCKQNKIRRLSTVNAVVEPDFIHTTEWLWYWEDEFGKWNLYGSNISGHRSADISSAKLEQKFLDNNKDVVEFTAGSQSYSLSFEDMIQTNKHYGTKRLVRRRPLFVSAAEVKTKKVKKPLNSYPVPDNWDKTQIPETGFSRVGLQRTSEEFLKIQTSFASTMQDFEIIAIERIQNKALWEVFQWQKNLMKNNNGGLDVTEKQLFHGTDSNHVQAICLNNFDWRICGSHGTVYGKGSYFARDARYSHGYTGDSNIKTMFICRVLVGSYTKGYSSYVKPPSKDGGDLHFYDSCVDDVTNPSIFVVFEKHQIYPEYLLQYKTTDPPAETVTGAQPNSCVIT